MIFFLGGAMDYSASKLWLYLDRYSTIYNFWKNFFLKFLSCVNKYFIISRSRSILPPSWQIESFLNQYFIHMKTSLILYQWKLWFVPQHFCVLFVSTACTNMKFHLLRRMSSARHLDPTFLSGFLKLVQVKSF